VSVTSEFVKVLPDKWTFTFDVDMTKKFGGRSAKAQRAALLTAIKQDPLVEFTYRSDTGDTRNFYVGVYQAGGDEGTGYDEEGIMRLVAVEL
jgi:hypothetical protein